MAGKFKRKTSEKSDLIGLKTAFVVKGNSINLFSDKDHPHSALIILSWDEEVETRKDNNRTPCRQPPQCHVYNSGMPNHLIMMSRRRKTGSYDTKRSF